MQDKLLVGSKIAIKNDVLVKNDKIIEHKIKAGFIDKSAKLKGKNVKYLEVPGNMNNLESNGLEQYINIMMTGKKKIDVDGEIIVFRPTEYWYIPKTDKSLIFFEEI